MGVEICYRCKNLTGTAFGPQEFQRELTVFSLACLALDYYGTDLRPDVQQVELRAMLDARAVRRRFVTRLNEDCFGLTAGVILAEYRGDFALVLTSDDLANMYKKLNFRILSYLAREVLHPRFFETFEPLASAEALPPVPMVVSGAPRLELTMSLGGRLEDGMGGIATVGAFASRDEIPGFITVAHALDASAALHCGGRDYPENIAAVNRYWDGAWLPLAINEVCEFPPTFPFDHPTCPQLAPRQSTEGFFYGTSHAQKRTIIDSVEMLVGRLTPFQTRFITKRCTEVGDSGAILWNDEQEGLGMAIGRTTDEDAGYVSYSYWSWLPGLLSVLDAKLMSRDEATGLGARIVPKPKDLPN